MIVAKSGLADNNHGMVSTRPTLMRLDCPVCNRQTLYIQVASGASQEIRHYDVDRNHTPSLIQKTIDMLVDGKVVAVPQFDSKRKPVMIDNPAIVRQVTIMIDGNPTATVRAKNCHCTIMEPDLRAILAGAETVMTPVKEPAIVKPVVVDADGNIVKPKRGRPAGGKNNMPKHTTGETVSADVLTSVGLNIARVNAQAAARRKGNVITHRPGDSRWLDLIEWDMTPTVVYGKHDVEKMVEPTSPWYYLAAYPFVQLARADRQAARAADKVARKAARAAVQTDGPIVDTAETGEDTGSWITDSIEYLSRLESATPTVDEPDLAYADWGVAE